MPSKNAQRNSTVSTEEVVESQPDFRKTFGWIDLGAMGFPMALQLRAKVPPETAVHYGGALERLELSINSSILSTHASSPTLSNPPLKFFDAPVSGSTADTSKGTCTYTHHHAGLRPGLALPPLLTRILRTMGTNVYALGGPLLGLAVKLSNNYLSGMIALVTSEAMNLGTRLGVDPRGSWVNDTVNYVPRVSPESKGDEGVLGVQLVTKIWGWLPRLFMK
ncbi:hypothetical protein BDN70DRAFT_895273 [Pholiota conissans]|uniref:Uncharacterized protein n=1 Tax=Pholiota conissans TaxID=109636 RepID=A0A9P6CU13_9AGAR|nr:hypothetical protein BDN70DRAFT_895273 [Pholiota conissans]